MVSFHEYFPKSSKTQLLEIGLNDNSKHDSESSSEKWFLFYLLFLRVQFLLSHGKKSKNGIDGEKLHKYLEILIILYSDSFIF